jgi:hypothetical protein
MTALGAKNAVHKNTACAIHTEQFEHTVSIIRLVRLETLEVNTVNATIGNPEQILDEQAQGADNAAIQNAETEGQPPSGNTKLDYFQEHLIRQRLGIEAPMW